MSLLRDSGAGIYNICSYKPADNISWLLSYNCETISFIQATVFCSFKTNHERFLDENGCCTLSYLYVIWWGHTLIDNFCICGFILYTRMDTFSISLCMKCCVFNPIFCLYVLPWFVILFLWGPVILSINSVLYPNYTCNGSTNPQEKRQWNNPPLQLKREL